MKTWLFWSLNSWPSLFLIGLTLFMCIQYQDMIKRAPETKDEYVSAARSRAKMFLWASVISGFLTVITHGREDSSLFTDISFTLSLLICWLYNRWFLKTLRTTKRRQ